MIKKTLFSFYSVSILNAYNHNLVAHLILVNTSSQSSSISLMSLIGFTSSTLSSRGEVFINITCRDAFFMGSWRTM